MANLLTSISLFSTRNLCSLRFWNFERSHIFSPPWLFGKMINEISCIATSSNIAIKQFKTFFFTPNFHFLSKHFWFHLIYLKTIVLFMFQIVSFQIATLPFDIRAVIKKLGGVFSTFYNYLFGWTVLYEYIKSSDGLI